MYFVRKAGTNRHLGNFKTVNVKINNENGLAFKFFAFYLLFLFSDIFIVRIF